MSILIVGATGRVGSAAAHTLARQGWNVTALVRGGLKHPGAKRLLDAGVRIIEGDLRRHESLDEAVKGAETVICSATARLQDRGDALQTVDRDGTLTLIETAEKRSVKRFIYVSHSENIRWDSPLQSAKRDCEDCLLHSKLQAVILRPSFFMEAWLSPMVGFDPAAGSVRIYGTGEARISYISTSNVADFAVDTATGEPGRKNTILEMGGPEDISQLEAVGIFERMLGVRMKREYISVDQLREQHASPDPLQRSLAALMLAYAAGDSVQGAIQNAERHNVQLISVFEYASHFPVPLGIC